MEQGFRLVRHKRVVVRKRHECFVCGSWIEKGETAVLAVYELDNKIQTYHRHLHDCRECEVPRMVLEIPKRKNTAWVSAWIGVVVSTTIVLVLYLPLTFTRVMSIPWEMWLVPGIWLAAAMYLSIRRLCGF